MTAELLDPPVTFTGDTDEPEPDAPFGWMTDRVTGERRPKLRPGRQRLPDRPAGENPTLDELKADKTSRKPDRAPEKPPKTRKHQPVPAYKPGVITAGMNKLYRRTGKIIKVWDADIGEAFITSTINTADPDKPDEDDSVGYAWDQLAKVNPRVRRFLLKLIKGGVYGQLAMAHLPIAAAIVMKPVIRDHIPFGKILANLAEPDESGDGSTGLPADLTTPDVQDMAAIAAEQMAKMGINLDPETAAKMAQMAETMQAGMGNGTSSAVAVSRPVTAVRTQRTLPRKRTRAGK